MRTADCWRRGTTLLELMLALALLGMLVALLHAAAATVAVEGANIPRRASADDHRAIGELLLRRLLENTEATGDTSTSFRGGALGMSFRTSCPAPGGWGEPCVVEVSIDNGADSSSVIVTRSDGVPIRALRVAGTLTLRYRIPGNRAAWIAEWGGTISLPTAVGVVTDSRDTIAFFIGDRG